MTTKYIQEGISEKKYDYLLVESQYRYIHDKSNMRKQGESKNEKANYCVAGYTLMLRILDYIEVHSEKNDRGFSIGYTNNAVKIKFT